MALYWGRVFVITVDPGHGMSGTLMERQLITQKAFLISAAAQHRSSSSEV